MIIEYDGIKPKIGANVFIAPTAVVVGPFQPAASKSMLFEPPPCQAVPVQIQPPSPSMGWVLESAVNRTGGVVSASLTSTRGSQVDPSVAFSPGEWCLSRGRRSSRLPMSPRRRACRPTRQG